MSEFVVLANLVNAQLTAMSKNNLFQVEVDKDVLWETYINGFKPHDNPMFRERSEHDCTCCKQFIRAIGGVVNILDGNVITPWDLVGVPDMYKGPVEALGKLVRESAIQNLYLHEFSKIGKAETKSMHKANGVIETWNHFHFQLPAKFVSAKDADKIRGLAATNHQTLKRACTEISDSAIDTVLELIDGKSIYRGAEFRNAVFQFKGTKRIVQAAKDIDLACWEMVANKSPSVNIRNSVIGSLLVDLSEGMDLEAAVKSYEAKVAPSNYKRSSALVTPTMVANAEKAIVTLGVAAALPRRHAIIEDLTINNVLFANRNARTAMGVNVLDVLSGSVSAPVPNLSKLQEVSLEHFLANVLPGASSVEVYVENRHKPNLVSLIAPIDKEAPNILKWGNKFSWSYNGDVTDSIKDRVKSAGGDVTGEFRASLAWFNHDDLDLHLIEVPLTGRQVEVYFGNRQSRLSGAELDVDANRGDTTLTDTPVENITIGRIENMPLGQYTVRVDSWAKRQDINTGFVVEMEILGEVQTFTYNKPVRNGEKIDVVTLSKQQNKPLQIVSSIGSSVIPSQVWGLTTNQFVNVSTILNSPNHWDGEETGNKHIFFMLDNCVNPEGARGLYNEFLAPQFNEHRKVFELLGSKMKAPYSENQLSGLGFSTTINNHVVCRVKTDKTERTFKLII